MLSNCHITSIKYDNVKYRFDDAESMLDYSKQSILEGDYLICKRRDLANDFIINRIEFNEGNLFVFILLSNSTILATIKSVDFEERGVTIRFLNPDKSRYPDQTLEFDGLNSIYKVSEVHRVLNSINNLGPAL